MFHSISNNVLAHYSREVNRLLGFEFFKIKYAPKLETFRGAYERHQERWPGDMQTILEAARDQIAEGAVEGAIWHIANPLIRGWGRR